MAPEARLAQSERDVAYRGLNFSGSQPVAFRTSWASPVNATPSGGIYPAVPSKCQQRAFIRPISARYPAGLSLRVSERILVSRLESRSRRCVGEGRLAGSDGTSRWRVERTVGNRQHHPGRRAAKCWGFRLWRQMPRLRAGQVELTLQIVAGDLDVLHRHLGLDVAEERHQRRQADAGAHHLTWHMCV